MAATIGNTQTNSHDSDVTTHTVPYPTGLVSGSLMILYAAVDQGPTITAPAGWTELVNKSFAGGAVSILVCYAESDGTETGNISFTTSTAQESAIVVRRYANHEDVGTSPPEYGGEATGNSTSPDAAGLVPTGGALDYLWENVVAADGGAGGSISAYPTGWDYVQTAVETSGAGSADVGVAAKNDSGVTTSENPGAWTLSASDQWGTGVVAIYPGSAGGGSATIPDGTGAVEALNLIIDAKGGTRQGEIVGCLNEIAGTTGLGAQGALTSLGATSVELVGAINELAGSTGLELLAAIDAWGASGNF